MSRKELKTKIIKHNKKKKPEYFILLDKMIFNLYFNGHL